MGSGGQCHYCKMAYCICEPETYVSNKTSKGTPKMSNKTYTPRGTWVLIRQVRVDLTPGGIALADNSSDAYKHVIEAVGSKVEDIKPGDEVLALLMSGDAQNFVTVPGESLLIATKESNVLLIVADNK